VLLDDKVVADGTWQRIGWFIQHYLLKVAGSTGGWEALYRDPNDGRYWERTFPQSETHGGGAPSLNTITVGEAEKNYGAR
jgi:Immunity protein 27